MMRGVLAVVLAFAGELSGWAQPAPRADVDASSNAASIMEHSRLAREAIAAQLGSQALSEVNKALSLATDVLSKTSREARPVLIPISSGVERVTTYSPAKAGKQSKPSGNSSIRRVREKYSQVSLDVTLAANQLQKAKELLEKQDLSGADTELADIETGVVVRKGSADVPLLKTRENLMLARARILEGKWKDAQMPLHAASQALQDYFAESPGPQAGKAREMWPAMDKMATRLKKKPRAALASINQWLQEVDGFDQSGR